MNKARIMQLKTMPYDEYLKTPEWAQKREQALERDGHCCRACNSDENLQVHHRTYVRRGHEDLNDLTTLCQGCHEHFHERIKQIDLMERTMPLSTPDRKQDEQAWEYYLIGLLLQNLNLCLHVCGIVNEGDFSGEHTRELYQIILSTYQRDASISSEDLEGLIPVELQETVGRAQKRVQSKTPRDGGTLVKESIECAVRLKRIRLLCENAKIKEQIKEAAEAGDKQRYRELLQEFLRLRQQRQILDAASQLRM